ncbi:hypothetical protein P175DRAFT_0278046 [Aspergillus ochraceoroseus IBT 24754]|uniref:Uncharacterized protein n=1 Tax=Aspergillus ochraceoroseus IBT 24754 TaxID=1392256 RepID=A0A2T5LVJ4_9EURO|nr:uncharacterized protein P175DRAFT_0278046 [Aspergillus ochraceoroseus IBT 24754]PTU20301.1 hypothetical protein P175DRAFT_0278046 [Aspergillus ochraceoroseus IBT 24754]
MDRITEHTETRRALQEGQYTPTRSDSPIRTRRRRDIVRIPPTVSRYYETRNSSASSSSDDEWLTSRRRGVISNVVDTGSPNRRRRPLIRSDRPNRILWRRERYPSYLPRDCCSWPGCYSKYKQPLCRDALNDLFWNSSKATQTSSPELADDDVQGMVTCFAQCG